MAGSRTPAGARHRPSRDTLRASVGAALARAGLRGRRVALALSGGVDSVVLLETLAGLAPDHQIAL